MGLDHWIVDNTVISNFALIGQIEILKNNLTDKLYITDEVKKEFLKGIEKGVIPETDINWLNIVKCKEDEYPLFNKLRLRLGSGESACLAIAFHRKWKFLTDDIDARDIAQRFEVSVSGTIGQRGCINLDKSNRMLQDMINKGYYSPVEKLDDLLE